MQELRPEGLGLAALQGVDHLRPAAGKAFQRPFFYLGYRDFGASRLRGCRPAGADRLGRPDQITELRWAQQAVQRANLLATQIPARRDVGVSFKSEDAKEV